MARNEARFLQGLLRETVSSINLGLRIAYQFENIAVRMVQETKILNKQTKKDFFRSILYSDEKDKRNKFGKNGGCKTHQWFLKAVFGSAEKNPRKINLEGNTFFSVTDPDPFYGFSADGKVKEVDVQNVLSALPDDPHLVHLRQLFRDNEVVGNVILAARRRWFQGYEGRWSELPEIPSSWLLTPLLEELARDMDRDTATNLTKNFLRYQEAYIANQLQNLEGIDRFDEKITKRLPELLCYSIDQLPLDGREDLMRLEAEANVDKSPLLKPFIEEQRLKMAEMMNVDE